MENTKDRTEYMKEYDKKRNKKKAELKEMINDEVTNSMVDVVTTPIEKIKQKKVERKPVITEEQKKEYEFKQHKSLFS